MTGYAIAPLARGDLDDIWDYIASDNASAANRLLDELHQTFLLLGAQPLIGQTRQELRENLRSFSVGKYVIYYELVHRRIRVLRVLHGSRDVNVLF